MDTIFAVSSGAPPAAIAVLRLTGDRAFDAAELLAGTLPEPRRAGLRALRHPSDGELLDRALVLTFPGPRSASGEDLVELHLHGGRAVVRAVEAALGGIEGLRPAEPGEFTRRALLNGRLDLSEAEGLGDLLMAETEAQRRMATRSAEGWVRRQIEQWSERLLPLAAQVEAQLDHSDEEDVAGSAQSLEQIHMAVAALARDIAEVTARPPTERLRDGLRVVLAGPPNAGKSTLLNAMAARDAAIVSAIAGTTRDRIEAPIVRNGTAWLLIDTAGLAGATLDPIEAIGIDRARAALEEADILLWLGDDSPPPHRTTLWLKARADLPGRTDPGGRDVSLSAVTGAGIDELWSRLDAIAVELLPPVDLMAFNARQRTLAIRAQRALEDAAVQRDLLLLAEELGTARRAFDAVTGKADVEAMLDTLFSRFCIGK